MSIAFNRALSDACDDFFKNELLKLSHTEKDSVPEQVLSEDEIALLTQKISALPPEDSHVLFFRYCFHSSPEETSKVLCIENPIGLLRYIRDMLSSFMGLTGVRISDDSMEKACKTALEEYTKAQFDVPIKPQYSREFRKKLKKIKSAQSSIRARLSKQIAAAAIICIVCFGAALTTNANLRNYIANWIVETFPQFSIFLPEQSSSSSEAEPPNCSDFKIGYVPDGFELREKTEMQNMISYKYRNQEGSAINITISTPTNFHFDTEGAQMHEIPFKDATACYWTRDGITYFIWQQDGLTCYIMSKLSIEEVMKIAENVEK